MMMNHLSSLESRFESARLEDERPGAATSIELPLRLGNNDGTYMPEACADVLRRRTHRDALRRYAHSANDGLLRAIAARDGVDPAHILLHNGSGPLLKQVIPELVRTGIKSSWLRVARHFLTGSGYPIITPLFTYGKVPTKAAEAGLAVHAIEIGPEQSFRVEPEAIERLLRRGPGLVYLVNPNNPSGNVTIGRDRLEPVIAAHPESMFWIDEAYVEYCPAGHRSFSELVPRYPNLLVSRSFSFAWGLASAKVGYLLARPDLVAKENKKLTDHRIGRLAEELCVAALSDREHLPWLRAVCHEQRAILTEGLVRHGVEVFPSVTNFLLCRFTDGRSGIELVRRLAAHGIEIKALSPFAGRVFEPYFRITVGLAHENRHLLEVLHHVLGG